MPSRPCLSHRLLTFIAPLLLMLLAAAGAYAQIQITSCGTFINSAGDYVLANDLSNCTGDGIIMGNNAHGIVLSLAGHRITGSATASVRKAGIKIQSGAGARIVGPGTISGYTSGFGVLLASGTIDISGVTCTGNDVGFYFSGGVAVAHSNIANNNVDGFYASRGELTNNLATGNTQDGIVTDTLERSQLLNNTAAFNGRYGIVAPQYSGNKDIVSNTALDNGTYDLFEDNSGECKSAWVDNVFGTAKPSCIH